MKDFNNCKMYKLIVEGYDLIYIGHTCDELCKRLYRHKKSKDCGSKSLFDMGIVKIILIEKYPCLDMDEARRREQELIDEYKDICVNIRRAHCSNEHIPEYNKQYRLTYREQNVDIHTLSDLDIDTAIDIDIDTDIDIGAMGHSHSYVLWMRL